MTMWTLYYEVAGEEKRIASRYADDIAKAIKKADSFELYNKLGQKFAWRDSHYSNTQICRFANIPVAILKAF